MHLQFYYIKRLPFVFDLDKGSAKILTSLSIICENVEINIDFVHVCFVFAKPYSQTSFHKSFSNE